MRFLGIDYGEKRVGLALSDKEGKLAFPKEIILNSGNLFEYILKVIETEKIDEVVIGESLDYNGLPNEIEKKITNFAKELREKIKIPINRQKEFFTSVEARKLSDVQEYDKKIDDSAAALILQRYLDKINTNVEK